MDNKHSNFLLLKECETFFKGDIFKTKKEFNERIDNMSAHLQIFKIVPFSWEAVIFLDDNFNVLFFLFSHKKIWKS